MMLAPVVLVLLSAGCGEPKVGSVFDYGVDLGIAAEKADRTCLDIPNESLSVGQAFQFVTPSAPQTTGEAEITSRADQGCTGEDQNTPWVSHYEFKVIRGSLQKGAPAFAVVGFRGRLTATDGGVTGDLDGDGRLGYFRSSTSSEGVHLTVLTGKPVEGPRRWHHYY